MPVERALHQALDAKPEDVEMDELEAMVRRVVAEELHPLKEALAHSGTTAAPSGSADGSTGCGEAAGMEPTGQKCSIRSAPSTISLTGRSQRVFFVS